MCHGMPFLHSFFVSFPLPSLALSFCSSPSPSNSICSSSASVRGDHRPGARERSAGELESGLGWRDSQETTMGLSLGLLSRMGLVRWLPARGYPMGALYEGNLRRRLSSHPP